MAEFAQKRTSQGRLYRRVQTVFLVGAKLVDRRVIVGNGIAFLRGDFCYPTRCVVAAFTPDTPGNHLERVVTNGSQLASFVESLLV